MTQLGTVITTITGSPLLLLGFLMALVGSITGSTQKLCERKEKRCRFIRLSVKPVFNWVIPSQAVFTEGVETIPSGSRIEFTTIRSAQHVK